MEKPFEVYFPEIRVGVEFCFPYEALRKKYVLPAVFSRKVAGYLPFSTDLAENCKSTRSLVDLKVKKNPEGFCQFWSKFYSLSGSKGKTEG